MKFRPLNEIINKLIKNLNIEDQILENQAIFYWSTVVGLHVAKNTKPERVKDGILFVKVKNDVWRNELLFYKKDFIEKLNKKLGKKIIYDIILF